MTVQAIENAIRVFAAIGGSTNAIIHLVAIAGRLGIKLPLTKFDELSRETPVIANILPSGKYLMENFYYAGGLPAVMKEILPMLHGDQVTASGKTIAENVAQAECHDREVIRSVENPVHPKGSFVVLHGNLAPNGAVLKASAASAELLQHTGSALVFEDYEEMLLGVEDPSLDVNEDSVLVLKNAGPVGGPGMPEWGQIPIPAKLLKRGVKDMVRISDSRMSGTSFGAVVLHVAPESAVGGPLAVVENGDPIRLDVESRRLDLLIPEEKLQRRLNAWRPTPNKYRRGYYTMFLEHILQADKGCDFDFLAGAPGDEPYEPIVGRS